MDSALALPDEAPANSMGRPLAGIQGAWPWRTQCWEPWGGGEEAPSCRDGEQLASGALCYRAGPEQGCQGQGQRAGQPAGWTSHSPEAPADFRGKDWKALGEEGGKRLFDQYTNMLTLVCKPQLPLPGIHYPATPQCPELISVTSHLPLLSHVYLQGPGRGEGEKPSWGKAGCSCLRWSHPGHASLPPSSVGGGGGVSVLPFSTVGPHAWTGRRKPS